MDKYLILGLSVISIMVVFAYFLDDSNVEYDHTGIVSGIKGTSSGYTFYLEENGRDIKCFYSERPNNLGLYSIKGNYSDDGSIFFVSRMMDMDMYRNQD